jgi:Sec-independent protein translocase protein TatA
VTEPPSPRRPRIRWAWFLACVLLGGGVIVAGLLIAPLPERAGYLAGVLGGVGTTLLLVGVVVLLERRILETAVRVVGSATRQARAEMDQRLREQIGSLDTELADLWAQTTPEEVDRKTEQMRRTIDEFTARVVADHTHPTR